MASADEPTDLEFRAAGKTAAARNFPLSVAGWTWIAKFNNISVHLMPEVWKYASNAYMREYIEEKAAMDEYIHTQEEPQL